MNRKDTILVAVLVNVGVLLILFISSLKPNSHQELQAQKPEAVVDDGLKIARVEPVKEPHLNTEVTLAIEQLLKQDEVKPALESVPVTIAAKEEKSAAPLLPAVAVKPKEKKVEAPQKSSEADERYYTVKNGDNPWTIATKNHIKVEELLRLNGLDDAKAKKIKPGDRLRIK